MRGWSKPKMQGPIFVPVHTCTPVDIFKIKASLLPSYMRDSLQFWLTVLRFTLLSIVNQDKLLKIYSPDLFLYFWCHHTLLFCHTHAPSFCQGSHQVWRNREEWRNMVCKLSVFNHDAMVYASMTFTAVFVYCRKRYQLKLVLRVLGVCLSVSLSPSLSLFLFQVALLSLYLGTHEGNRCSVVGGGVIRGRECRDRRKKDHTRATAAHLRRVLFSLPSCSICPSQVKTVPRPHPCLVMGVDYLCLYSFYGL